MQEIFEIKDNGKNLLWDLRNLQDKLNKGFKVINSSNIGESLIYILETPPIKGSYVEIE